MKVKLTNFATSFHKSLITTFRTSDVFGNPQYSNMELNAQNFLYEKQTCNNKSQNLCWEKKVNLYIYYWNNSAHGGGDLYEKFGHHLHLSRPKPEDGARLRR